MTQTAQATAVVTPFQVASYFSNRWAFVTATTALTTTQVGLTQISVPAVGYLDKVRMEVEVTVSGGTSPTWASHGCSLFQAVSFKNPGGAWIMQNLTGDDIFKINRGVAQRGALDPTVGFGAVPVAGATAATAKFYVDIPVGIDLRTAYGVVPATASNAEYQLNLILAPLATAFAGSPTVSVVIEGVAFFFDTPPASSGAVVNAQQPDALGTVELWNVETPTTGPGQFRYESQNVGNVWDFVAIQLQQSGGAPLAFPTDGSGHLSITVAGTQRFYGTYESWIRWNCEIYGLQSATYDSANGPQTGCIMIPFRFLLSQNADIADSSRAQNMVTLAGTSVWYQFDGLPANTTNLRILSGTISTPDVSSVFANA